MGYQENIYIAGTQLKISSKFPLKCNRENQSYCGFYREKNIEGELVSLSVDLLDQEKINFDRKDMLFDGGQGWHLYKNEDEFVFLLDPPTFDQPVWAAFFNPQFSKGRVYCGPALVESHDGQPVITNPICYPLDQILLIHHLAKRKGLLLHAAGILVRDGGFVFAGRSGAGKSTISKHLLSMRGCSLLNDDRIFIRKVENQFLAFGTPWSGELTSAQNNCAALPAIVYVNQSPSNRIVKLDPQQALNKLFPVTSIPWYNKEFINEALAFCEELISHVPVYDLFFTPGEEVKQLMAQFFDEHS